VKTLTRPPASALLALALALAPGPRAQQPARADAAQAEATAAPSGARGGAITVRVVGEDNQPVPNAVVTAQRLGAQSNFAVDNSGATTGRYVLSNLDPGIYRVGVRAAGFVLEDDPLADPAERNLFRPGDTASFRLVRGGVITGRVTDGKGDPAVGAPVSVMRVRDAAGRPLAGAAFEAFYSRWRTDDRGVYRIYGLPAGSYLVRAAGRGSQNFSSRPSAYDSDSPTYYPSATRDGAVEVQVQTGQEATDIDIRHRGERGHAVSGTVVGAFGAGQFGGGGASVLLRHVASGASEGTAFVSGAAETRSFAFEGVADGDYELTASSGGAETESGTASAPLRVTVRGADLTGLRLALAPLASLSGRVAFEPMSAADAARPDCKGVRQPAMYESLVTALREAAADEPSNTPGGMSERAPDERGEFTLRNLTAGRYRLGMRLHDDNLFARSITQAVNTNTPAGQSAATSAPRPNVADIARNGISVAAGERAAGVTVSVAQGAASLRGRLAFADDAGAPAGNWRVHLVPAEPERADDVLRYAETLALPDGSFAFRNLAPGRYHLLARAVAESELRRATSRRRAAWDAAARAELRREAEAARNAVALTPCQRAEDFTLRLDAR
jgi:hypothetical protein